MAALAVDRSRRSLPGPVAFPSGFQASGCDLSRMLGVFAEFERTIIVSRLIAGQARARAKGVKFGRRPLAPSRVEKVRRALADGRSIRTVAKATGV